MKNDKVIEEVNVEEVVEEVEVTETKAGLLDKPKAFLQKHGKKVGAVIALILIGGAVYAIGKQAGGNGDDTDDDDYTYNETSDDYDSESNTTEL